ncbi:MAG: hypothetical protein IPM29_06090 [Planctomycetes bacterium]|nr:hypothetical protein [Planctomycetota bacterium]
MNGNGIGYRRAAGILAMLVLSVGRGPAQGGPDASRRGAPGEGECTAAELDAASARYDRMSTRRRERVVELVRDAVLSIDDRYVTALAELAAAGDGAQRPRVRGPREQRLGRGSETGVGEARPLVARLPFVAARGYRFGAGTVDDLELRDERGRVVTRTRRAARLRELELEAMLDGRLPDLDAALATLLARLDDQRGFDREAVFLDAWTNGAESFFDALDRTAGREEGVFHYDAMLDEWLDHCVPADHADRSRFRRGQDELLRGFQDAFVSYRSYRSVREMLALTLVLAPDDPLPAPLDRYEMNGGAGHSTRECVDVVLAVCDDDPRRVAELFLEHAEALQAEPWESRHEAWRGIGRMFDAVRERAMATGCSTFELAARSRQHRLAVRELVGRVARTAFVRAVAAS